MPENNIPTPKQVAARVQPKVVAVRKGWHTVPVTDLQEGDLMRRRLGGNLPTYCVERIDGVRLRLVPYSTVGVDKAPPLLLDTRVTGNVWKWF